MFIELTLRKEKINQMELKIIPKQNANLIFDTKAIQLKHIEYYPSCDGVYEEKEITDAVISKILGQIPNGINVYLSLDPYGEDDWLEVISDGEWLALGYCFNGGCDIYYSYNADFAGTEELSPLESGGQSPIEKYLALKDIEAGRKAVEYFIQTGELYPGIAWAQQL